MATEEGGSFKIPQEKDLLPPFEARNRQANYCLLREAAWKGTLMYENLTLHLLPLSSRLCSFSEYSHESVYKQEGELLLISI